MANFLFLEKNSKPKETQELKEYYGRLTINNYFVKSIKLSFFFIFT